jgi:hypothetical protein
MVSPYNPDVRFNADRIEPFRIEPFLLHQCVEDNNIAVGYQAGYFLMTGSNCAAKRKGDL